MQEYPSKEEWDKLLNWDTLLDRIKDGKCTPFLGAGACDGVLPLGSTIAKKWADTHNYPMEDCTDLARVAQYIAVRDDQVRPKELLIKEFRGAKSPDFTDPYEPHSVLADLPLPIYLTTNYDNFMTEALRSKGKHPVQEICRWNKQVPDRRKGKSATSKAGLLSQVDKDHPGVFHLHGNVGDLDSIVISEDDYLDFLVNITDDQSGKILPARIKQAMTSTSLLFLGYRLSDWNFRVLFRSLVSFLERSLIHAHISVQLAPVKIDASAEQKKNVQDFLQSYFKDQKIHVCWVTCQNFTRELKDRWTEYIKNESGEGS